VHYITGPSNNTDGHFSPKKPMVDQMFDVKQPSYRRFRLNYAEKPKRIVAWVGSGLSTPAGLPMWPQLRKKLVEDSTAKALTMDNLSKDKLLKLIAASNAISDSWTAFDVLHDAIGRTSFQASIRELLTPVPGYNVPFMYNKLWGMPVAGIVTLNIDRFASRSYHDYEKKNVVPIEASGFSVGNYMHALGGSRPFVINLHGIIDDASSWVFRKVELDALQSKEGYSVFLSTLFSVYTVLFIGISADDVSAGGTLGKLRKAGIDTGSHYWLTDRIDADTESWAEDNGIQVMRYSSKNGHEDPINYFINDVKSFVSIDEEAPPVVQQLTSFGSMISEKTVFPNSQSLSKMDPEEIRLLLSIKASEILKDGDVESRKQYEKFVIEYERAIFNSWFVSVDAPDNVLFRCKIENLIGAGAFGQVYKAISPDGDIVAIKILRESIRSDRLRLGSFRRGVKAMQILSRSGVTGMVNYREAYELPPCVIMDYIDGINLQLAVESRSLDAWTDGIKIGIDVAKIIKSGHYLPERVLHRDIRPPNIMLRNFYSVDHDWDVVVLDFDLSWHKGAAEQSIVDIHEGSALGYLAPEQLSEIRSVSTRSALVDSYGLGMTIYYIFTGSNPKPGDSNNENWINKIEREISRTSRSVIIKSFPSRLARIIQRATCEQQSMRIDIGQIEFCLNEIRDAINSPWNVSSAEFWGEEMLHWAFNRQQFEWDVDRSRGSIILPTGVTIIISSDEEHKIVNLKVTHSQMGNEKWKDVQKFMPTARDKSTSMLRKAGWDVQKCFTSGKETIIEASCSVSTINKGEASFRSIVSPLSQISQWLSLS